MATLLDIKKQFIEKSGRYDLVADVAGDDYTDAGPVGTAFYINAGLRWLDSRVKHRKVEAEIEISVALGEYQKSFVGARSVLGVRLVDDPQTEGSTELIKLTRDLLYHKYGGDGSLASVDQGRPCEYAIDILRDETSPQTDAQEQNYGIIFMPPADKAYKLFVRTLHFSTALSADDDDNWWTLQYPELVVYAALMFLEQSYRNTQGVSDWRALIVDSLQGIDFDQVETEIADQIQMADSWSWFL